MFYRANHTYMPSLFDLVSVVEKFYSLEKALKDECVALLIKCNKQLKQEISASWRHILILFFNTKKGICAQRVQYFGFETPFLSSICKK